MVNPEIIKSEYKDWISYIKDKIHSAKNKVALSINQQLIELYWELGKEITTKITGSNWGSKVIDQISIDLKSEFPEMKGFSKRNLYAIRQWYLFYSEQFEFVPQSVAQLPWGHNRLIITKIKDVEIALFYAKETVNNGWPRDILEVQISDNLIARKGGKSGKFKPEYAGKLNFYLSAVDSLLKKDIDNPTIGILLCKKKDKIEAEYALRDMTKPMGISEYRLTEAIPENIKTKLPSIEELEEDLQEKLNNQE